MMGRKEREIIMEKMEKEEIKKAIMDALEKEKEKARSAWSHGVVRYAIELMNNVDGKEVTEKNLLGGANNWHQYSEGGYTLIYDELICHRLCTPSEIEKTKDGEYRPNKQENWLDTQARALYQAARLIMKIKGEVEK